MIEGEGDWKKYSRRVLSGDESRRGKKSWITIGKTRFEDGGKED